MHSPQAVLEAAAQQVLAVFGSWGNEGSSGTGADGFMLVCHPLSRASTLQRGNALFDKGEELLGEVVPIQKWGVCSTRHPAVREH
jgi:hypothetical protein